MSGIVVDRKVKNRRLVIRLGLIVIYIFLLALILVTGKGHQILIDNKDAADGSYTAIDGMEVSVDGGESVEYYPGDRDRALVKGQKHKIKVVFFDEGVAPIEKTFTVPLTKDLILLSVPKMVAGIEPFAEEFISAGYVAAPPEEPEEGTEGALEGGLLPEPPVEAIAP